MNEPTDDELRVRVAELCGWTYIHGSEPTYGGTYVRSGWKKPDGDFVEAAFGLEHCSVVLPDYTGSYDAILPEIAKLTGPQTFRFIEHLRVIRNIEATGDRAFTWIILTATPRQLCLAYVATLAETREDL